MKKIITLVFLTMLSISAVAATKCVPSSGGLCCWDTDTDGPFKPPVC
jgi:hypothetical protein